MKKFFTLLCQSPAEHKIVLKLTRQGFYFTFLLAVVLGLWRLSDSYKTNTFAEYGLVENIQLATLFLTTLIFFITAFKNICYRSVLILLASLTAFCCIRELDSFFENLFPVISWKFAFLFPTAALIYACSSPKNFRKYLFDFFNSSAFDLMFTAMIIFVPLAQCIGHRSFIEDAIGSNDNTSLIRRLIEESTELIAYVLIFLSSIEMYFKVSRKEK